MSNPKLPDFNFDLAALRRYEISLKNGTTVRTDGSAEEHARAMEMMAEIDRTGMIDPEHRPLRSATATAKRIMYRSRLPAFAMSHPPAKTAARRSYSRCELGASG